MGAPRYKAGEKRDPKTQEVEIEDLGASFVLKAFTLRERTKWFSEHAEEDLGELADSERIQRNEEIATELISRCLIEPKLTLDELRKEVAEWPPAAFDQLSEAASELIGVSEEVLRAAQAEFRDSDD